MRDNKRYPELRRRLSPGWWTASRHYAMYMVRAWTSLFVALYSLIFIYGLSLWALGSSADFLNFLKNPAVIGFSLVALVFTMYHAVTWLPPRRNITGQDRKEQNQALASTHPQPNSPRDSLVFGGLASGVAMKMETHKVARLHAILWGIFSLGGMVAAFLLPVMIYMTAIAYPFGIWPFKRE